MTTVTVKKAADGFSITLKSGVAADFNNAIGTLKSYIHASARSYDPQSRQWHVDMDAQTEFDRWVTYLVTVLGARLEWQHADADAALRQSVARLHDIGHRYADASRELARLVPAGATAVDRGLVTPPLEFAEAIFTALQHANHEADRQRRKAASRAAGERERERAAAQRKAA
jgi:hypothetical protein